MKNYQYKKTSIKNVFYRQKTEKPDKKIRFFTNFIKLICKCFILILEVFNKLTHILLMLI